SLLPLKFYRTFGADSFLSAALKSGRTRRVRIKSKSREEKRQLINLWREEKLRQAQKKDLEALEERKAKDRLSRRQEAARRRRAEILKEQLYEYELDKEMIKESRQQEAEADRIRAKLAAQRDARRRQLIKQKIAEWRESGLIEDPPVSIATSDSRGDGLPFGLRPNTKYGIRNYAATHPAPVKLPPMAGLGRGECTRLLKELHRQKLIETRMADEIDRLEREGQLEGPAVEGLRQRQRDLSSASTDLEVSRQLEREASLEAERSHRELDRLRLENARLKRELEDRTRDGALLLVNREQTIHHLRRALASATSWALENDEAKAAPQQPHHTTATTSPSSTLGVELGLAPAPSSTLRSDYFETYDTSECAIVDAVREKSTPVKPMTSELQTEPRSSLRSRRSGYGSANVADVRFSPGCVSEASSRASFRSGDVDSHDSSNCSTNPGMPNGRPKFSLGLVSREPRRGRQTRKIDAGSAANAACPTQ
ncbi:hypothetical protein FOZ63_030905, partial [Perkinsus olseni]